MPLKSFPLAPKIDSDTVLAGFDDSSAELMHVLLHLPSLSLFSRARSRLFLRITAKAVVSLPHEDDFHLSDRRQASSSPGDHGSASSICGRPYGRCVLDGRDLVNPFRLLNRHDIKSDTKRKTSLASFGGYTSEDVLQRKEVFLKSIFEAC